MLEVEMFLIHAVDFEIFYVCGDKMKCYKMLLRPIK